MRFIEDTASKADGVKLPVLLSLNEMPKWFQLQSNRYILHGYRTTSGSAYDSYSSWSYIHNESLDIYSHLIPVILFLSGAFYIQRYLVDRYREVAVADIIVFSIFMLAAVISLSLSATYHTLMNHSEHLNHLCLRLDMLGVVVFILGDLVLGIYLVFWCEPCLRNIYWSMVGIFGILTIFLTMHLKFQGSKHRLFRALMFVITGFFGTAPLTHGLVVFGMSQMIEKGFLYTVAKAGCLIFGTLFYATRFPESRYPGKFNLWGSHLIFHILVVCAAVVQLMGYLDAFERAHKPQICPSKERLER